MASQGVEQVDLEIPMQVVTETSELKVGRTCCGWQGSVSPRICAPKAENYPLEQPQPDSTTVLDVNNSSLEPQTHDRQVADRMEGFRKSREQKKAIPQRRVLRFGGCICLVGVLIIIVSRALSDTDSTNDWQPVSVITILVGGLIMTTVELDLDVELTATSTTAKATYLVMFCVLFVCSLGLAAIDCPTYIIGTVPPLYSYFSFCCCRPVMKPPDFSASDCISCISNLQYMRPTKMIAGWVILTFGVGVGIRMVFYTLYMYDQNLVEYESEAARIVNLIIGCIVAVVGSFVMYLIFVKTRNKERGEGYTNATYSTIYFGTFLFGIYYLTELATRNLNGTNKHYNTKQPTPSPSVWGRLSVSLTCIILSALVFYLRMTLFGLMARLFEDKQRVKDGAFLAALIADQDPQELMWGGLRRLRRVNIRHLDMAVMGSQHSDDEMVNRLSKQCRLGEIDFFVSHSWSDDPQSKCDALAQVADQFEKENGRDAYVWLDKLCIDQQDISIDLQCLPVFVMAAKKLMILSGPTYPTRLWCAWEMYVFFAMAPDVTKLEIVPLAGSTDTLAQLKTFKASEARCWNPDDEVMLRSIIGEDTPRFESEIRQAASDLEPSVMKLMKSSQGAMLESGIRDVASQLEKQQKWTQPPKK